jgi:hypothetical protein
MLQDSLPDHPDQTAPAMPSTPRLVCICCALSVLELCFWAPDVKSISPGCETYCQRCLGLRLVNTNATGLAARPPGPDCSSYPRDVKSISPGCETSWVVDGICRFGEAVVMAVSWIAGAFDSSHSPVSPEATSFLASMMAANPADRPTARDDLTRVRDILGGGWYLPFRRSSSHGCLLDSWSSLVT